MCQNLGPGPARWAKRDFLGGRDPVLLFGGLWEVFHTNHLKKIQSFPTPEQSFKAILLKLIFYGQFTRFKNLWTVKFRYSNHEWRQNICECQKWSQIDIRSVSEAFQQFLIFWDFLKNEFSGSQGQISRFLPLCSHMRRKLDAYFARFFLNMFRELYANRNRWLFFSQQLVGEEFPRYFAEKVFGRWGHVAQSWASIERP
jgi:hypothetical protein